MIDPLDAIALLDFIGHREACWYPLCSEQIWSVHGKGKGGLRNYTADLKEHKHGDKLKKAEVKKLIENERRSPGGTW
jgi:hypothetical protein